MFLSPIGDQVFYKNGSVDKLVTHRGDCFVLNPSLEVLYSILGGIATLKRNDGSTVFVYPNKRILAVKNEETIFDSVCP